MQRKTKWVALQMVYSEVLNEIEELFATRGFKFMPIKGAYLIRSGLASSITEREMRDIDLLIPEEDFDEVYTWFAQHKNVATADNYWNFERSFVYTFDCHHIYLEFHRLLNLQARFLLPNHMLFNHGVQVGKSCVFPDPVDVLLIHICHAIAHVLHGFKVQFYREVELISNLDGFSWETFWRRAEETEILSFIWLVIQKCNRLLNTSYPLPKTPSVYVSLLGKLNLFMECRSAIVRRLFFEVPFVRSRIKLLQYKMKHRIMLSRTCSESKR